MYAKAKELFAPLAIYNKPLKKGKILEIVQKLDLSNE